MALTELESRWMNLGRTLTVRNEHVNRDFNYALNCNWLEVDCAGHGDGGAVWCQYVEVCGALVGFIVERRVVVRNIMRSSVVDSLSNALRILRACQVGHQLQQTTWRTGTWKRQLCVVWLARVELIHVCTFICPERTTGSLTHCTFIIPPPPRRGHLAMMRVWRLSDVWRVHRA